MANMIINASVEWKAHRAIAEYKKWNKEMYTKLRNELERDWIII